MTVKNSKGRQGGKVAMDEALVGTTEKVLKRIKDLYDAGMVEEGAAANSPGIGLKAIAESPQLQLQVKRPRKKITVMIIGNHSAGKSSFINWYTGENIQKTGVAIETRGFTFVTCGKKRETLTGESTLKYFDYLEGFGKFPGIMANLFTEVSTSKEKSFSCVDLIDTPGLVDGDMQYPFDVQDSILWLAEHADLILIFFDPIGQATCKRTLQVVERLNNSAHVEKIHYFMSKADVVEREHDRQRVLIQITYNLATRIRNSHAFKLPTFYLPKPDDPDCSIPNAIEEVCMEIDKAINMGVQRNLKTLQEDCDAIQRRTTEVLATDAQRRAANSKRRFRGAAWSLLASLALTATLLIIALRAVPFICHVFKPEVCQLELVQRLGLYQAHLAANFSWLFTSSFLLTLLFWILARLTWNIKPTFSKKDIQRLGEFQAHVQRIADQEKELYDQYFKSLRLLEDQ